MASPMPPMPPVTNATRSALTTSPRSGARSGSRLVEQLEEVAQRGVERFGGFQLAHGLAGLALPDEEGILQTAEKPGLIGHRRLRNRLRIADALLHQAQ